MLRKTTITTIAGVLVFCLLFLEGLAVAQSPSLSPIIHIPPIKIDKSDTQYRNPVIAISPKSLLTIVAESGPIGQRRLVIAELNRGWIHAFPIEVSGPGDCRNPSIAYDSEGILHLAWSEKVGPQYVIRYATYTPEGRWRNRGFLSVTPELDCNLPQLVVDKQGHIWTTWQAEFATQSDVYLTRRENDAAPLTIPIRITGEGSAHHKLHPQLFPDSPYPLIWYEEVGTQLELRAAVPEDASGKEFEIIAPLDFDRLDTNQQPRLFQAPSGMLGGIWTDLVSGRERVFLGLQDEKTRGKGVIADTTNDGDVSYPSALTVGNNTAVLAWIHRLPTGTQQIMVGCMDDTSQVGPSLSLAQLADGTYSRPQLVSIGGFVHCVWTADATRGGSGDLYYCALQFKL